MYRPILTMADHGEKFKNRKREVVKDAPLIVRGTHSMASNEAAVQSAIEQMKLAIVALEFHPDRLHTLEVEVSATGSDRLRTRKIKIVLIENGEQ